MSTAETTPQVDYEQLKDELKISINNFVKKYVNKVIDDDDIDRFKSNLEELIKHYGVLKSKIEKGQDFKVPEISIVMEMDDHNDDGQVDLEIKEGNEITKSLMEEIFTKDLATDYSYKFTNKDS